MSKSFDLYKHNFNLSDIPLDAVQVMRANASSTGSQCGGHKKAARNDELEAFYEAYLTFREAEIDYSIKGVFNGPGSA